MSAQNPQHHRTPISEVISHDTLNIQSVQPFEIFEVQDIQTSEELSLLISSQRINIVDCYADWCGPCKRIYPSFKKMSEEYSANQKLRFFKLNIDVKDEQVQEFVAKNEISFIPFFLMVENGETTRTFSNFTELQEFITKNF